MRKLKIAAAILAAAVVFAPMQASARVPLPVAGSTAAPILPWLIFACASGIILAAAIANTQPQRRGRAQGRQLTAAEAATCGLLFLLNSETR